MNWILYLCLCLMVIGIICFGIYTWLKSKTIDIHFIDSYETKDGAIIFVARNGLGVHFLAGTFNGYEFYYTFDTPGDEIHWTKARNMTPYFVNARKIFWQARLEHTPTKRFTS